MWLVFAWTGAGTASGAALVASLAALGLAIAALITVRRK